jgi:hypothetical protein
MAIVPSIVPLRIPTILTPLPALLCYTESLGLEWYLVRPKRGLATLVVVDLTRSSGSSKLLVNGVQGGEQAAPWR